MMNDMDQFNKKKWPALTVYREGKNTSKPLNIFLKCKMRCMSDLLKTKINKKFKNGDLKYNVIKLVKNEMNNETIINDLKLISEYVNMETGFTTDKKVKNQIIFIAWISTKSRIRVIGYLEAKRIEKSYKFLNYNDGILSVHPEPVFNAKIGITKLWTTNNYRKLGVASRMLEMCCRYFYKNRSVTSPFDVAFSSLTKDGFILISKFYRNELDKVLIFMLK